MAIRRGIFLIVTVTLMLSGLLFGVAGGASVVAHFLGPDVLNAKPYSLSPKVGLATLIPSVGAAIGYAGVVSLAVLPLHFLFPNAAVRFRWQSKDSA
jgi:hypothetical protein